MAQDVQPGGHEVQAGELGPHLTTDNTDDTDRAWSQEWISVRRLSKPISGISGKVFPCLGERFCRRRRSMPIFKPLSMMLVACAIVGAARLQAWAQTPSSLSQEDRDAEVRQLRELVLKLQARVEQLEAHEHAVDPVPHRPAGPSAAAES